jgi:hypothetical protein
MKQLSNEVQMSASAEQVWQVLIDFATFPQWNPFLQRVRGILKKGEQLEVTVQTDGGQDWISRPTVVTVDPNRELRWREQSRIPGMLDVEHRFIIQTLDSGRVLFTQRAIFKGLLVQLGVYRRMDTRWGFRAMNKALKLRAEHIQSPLQ